MIMIIIIMIIIIIVITVYSQIHGNKKKYINKIYKLRTLII